MAAYEIAGGLAGLGFGVGECVCILAQTRLEWVLCDVGLALAGAVSVPIYPSSTPEQCAFIVKDSGARTVIAEDAAQLDKLVPLLAQIPNLRLRSLMDGGEPGSKDPAPAVKNVGDPRHCRWRPAPGGRAWLAGHAAELDRRAAEVGPDHVFTIVYTSGTTGRPKGVVLTHRNMVESFASVIRAFDLRDTDVQYLFLPLAHVLGARSWNGRPSWRARVCVFRGTVADQVRPGRGAAHLHGGRAARLREAARGNRCSGRAGECSQAGAGRLGLCSRCTVRSRPAAG